MFRPVLPKKRTPACRNTCMGARWTHIGQGCARAIIKHVFRVFDKIFSEFGHMGGKVCKTWESRVGYIVVRCMLLRKMPNSNLGTLNPISHGLFAVVLLKM